MATINIPKLGFLDHVALYVKDLGVSISWYEEVLGLKKYQMERWGPSPVFMLSGKCGVALFPIGEYQQSKIDLPKSIKIDHFAFNVNRENFIKAQLHYEDLKLDYNIQDHYYFHSIYTKDPDGHKVELTTLVVDEQEFYFK